MDRREEKEEKVLKYLRHFNEFIKPTELGEEIFGKPYYSASSFASPICRRLVEKGLVERNTMGHYRALPLTAKKDASDGVMLDLRNNGGRLFIQKYVKEEHRKLKLGIKPPTIAALERCIDLEDQLCKLKNTKNRADC